MFFYYVGWKKQSRFRKQCDLSLLEAIYQDIGEQELLSADLERTVRAGYLVEMKLSVWKSI